MSEAKLSNLKKNSVIKHKCLDGIIKFVIVFFVCVFGEGLVFMIARLQNYFEQLIIAHKIKIKIPSSTFENAKKISHFHR